MHWKLLLLKLDMHVQIVHIDNIINETNKIYIILKILGKAPNWRHCCMTLSWRIFMSESQGRIKRGAQGALAPGPPSSKGPPATEKNNSNYYF